MIFGKVFIPLAWLMGVQADQCASVATLIGFKTVVNEYVAFQKLGVMKENGLLSVRKHRKPEALTPVPALFTNFRLGKSQFFSSFFLFFFQKFGLEDKVPASSSEENGSRPGYPQLDLIRFSLFFPYPFSWVHGKK